MAEMTDREFVEWVRTGTGISSRSLPSFNRLRDLAAPSVYVAPPNRMPADSWLLLCDMATLQLDLADALRVNRELLEALLTVQKGIASDFECHLEDEQDEETGRCSGDNCVRCFVDDAIDTAISRAKTGAATEP